jgi:hypothetical protein
MSSKVIKHLVAMMDRPTTTREELRLLNEQISKSWAQNKQRPNEIYTRPTKKAKKMDEETEELGLTEYYRCTTHQPLFVEGGLRQ